MTAHRVARDVVRITGPEAPTYLHGQLSQDVEGLAPGTTTWSFVLQPAGKVDAWARFTRLADEEFLLDLEPGHGEALATRLKRFLLRTRAEVESHQWPCVAVRGAGTAGSAEGERDGDGDGDGTVLRLPPGWPGVEGYDLLGPGAAPPAGATEGDTEGYEALRIVAGVPAMGAELTEKTIPAEAGQWIIDASVDFTKGCFTGQELVARIDSRGGKVPRQLRGLVLETGEVPPVGAAIVVEDKNVGTVTSSAAAPPGSGAGPVALGYVARAVEPPAEASVTWDGDRSGAQVRALPLDLP